MVGPGDPQVYSSLYNSPVVMNQCLILLFLVSKWVGFGSEGLEWQVLVQGCEAWQTEQLDLLGDRYFRSWGELCSHEEPPAWVAQVVSSEEVFHWWKSHSWLDFGLTAHGHAHSYFLSTESLSLSLFLPRSHGSLASHRFLRYSP